MGQATRPLTGRVLFSRSTAIGFGTKTPYFDLPAIIPEAPPKKIKKNLTFDPRGMYFHTYSIYII